MPNRLGDTQIDRFIEDGFVKIEGAFPKEIAAQARSILWKDTGYDPQPPLLPSGLLSFSPGISRLFAR